MCIHWVYTDIPPFLAISRKRYSYNHRINKTKQKQQNKMSDLFSNTILCGKCNVKMKPIKFEKSGFVIRAVMCERCGDKIIHPKDEEEFKRFSQLRSKQFHVKMRIVGNSYAVSIPKEIVDFIKDQERIMDDMVRLCFNDARKLSMTFGEEKVEEEE